MAKKKTTKKKAPVKKPSSRELGKKTGLTASQCCAMLFRGNEQLGKKKKADKVKGSPLTSRKKPMTDEELQKFLKAEFPKRKSPDQIAIHKLRWFYTAGHWPMDSAPVSKRPSSSYDAKGNKIEVSRRGGIGSRKEAAAKKKVAKKKSTAAGKKRTTKKKGTKKKTTKRKTAKK